MKNTLIGFLLLHQIGSNLPILIKKNQILIILQDSKCSYYNDNKEYHIVENCSNIILTEKHQVYVNESLSQILKMKETK